MIIHIGGASGSGKSTLGDKLQKYFGDTIIVKDMDTLWNEFFIYQYETNKIDHMTYFETFASFYQKYIDDFIEKNKLKPIVFVGINVFIQNEKQYYPKTNDPNGPYYHGDLPQNVYFDVRANYKYYIDIDMNVLLEQLFMRKFSKICEDKQKIFQNLLKTPEKSRNNFLRDLEFITDFERAKKFTEKWNEYYKNEGYTFLDRDTIFDEVINLIKNNSKGGYYKKYIKYKTKYNMATSQQ